MNIEKLEVNKLKLTFEVSAERFEEGMKYSYNKNRSRINIPGFRKGKAPRKLIEVQYGKEVLFDDAINFVLPEAYENVIKVENIKTVSKPEIDVESVSTEEGVVFTAEVYIKPEVEINDYKGITYTAFEASPSEEEINQEIDKAREKNARLITITDRPVQDKDIVTIDFEGFVDGEAFEGGKGHDYDLTIGTKTFIDTFEEQLIGHSVGEDLEVNVNFPEGYHSEALSGKPAMFKVEIKDIKVKELPEVNDEFAQDVSEFDTLEDYKNNIKQSIVNKKENEAKLDKEKQVMTKIVANAIMDVPSVMIENQIDQLVTEFSNRLKAQGLPLDTYLQYVGQTEESLREAYRSNAEEQVKGRLALECIGLKEIIQVTEEDTDKEITRIANNYGMPKERLLAVLKDNDLSAIKEDILIQKALEFVIDNAVEVEAD